MIDAIDFSTFENALDELDRMYAYALSSDIKENPVLFGYQRTAIIKGFEYSYALSLKFMERFVEKRNPELFAESVPTFYELLRAADDYGIISGIPLWADYRKKRNITSHGYNVAVAEDIFAIVPTFAKEARLLLESMKERERRE